jgi:hypothetical protein
VRGAEGRKRKRRFRLFMSNSRVAVFLSVVCEIYRENLLPCNQSCKISA